MTAQFLQKPAAVICAAAVLSAVMLGAAMMMEPPVGSIEGIATAADTGQPISYASIYLHGSGKNWVYKMCQTDAEGRFRFESLPVGEYSLRADAKAHYMDEQKVAVVEDKTQKLYLELETTAPFLRLYISRQAFTSHDKPFFVLDGFTSGEGVDIGFYRIKPDFLFEGHGMSLRGMLASGASYLPFTAREMEESGAVDEIIKKFVRVINQDSEGTYHQTVKFEPMKPGVYVVVASASGVESIGVLTVSDVAIVTKESEGRLIVFSVDPSTGAPAAGAEVAVFESGRLAANGVTGSNGVWETKFAMSAGAPPTRFIAARLGDSTAFINSVSYERARSPVTIYGFTDRPIYRPGQRVYFKGIVRVFSGDSYHAPESGQCQVEVHDKRDTILYSETLQLSRFGTFKGSLRLPIYAATGSYDVVCTALGRTQTFSFDVAEYRKPEFEVSVEMPKKRCVRGEVVKAKVRANYYFGAPVAGAEVRYSVSRSDYWFWAEDEEFAEDFYYDEEMGDYEYYDDYGYGEDVASGTVKTDADGTAVIEFRTYWKTQKDDYYTPDQEFVLNVYVVDENRQEASAEASIVAVQGDFALDVEPQDYIAEVGRETSVVIRAADYNRKPQAGVEIEISAGMIEWSDEGESFEQFAKGLVKTDSDGRAVFAFKPSKPGSYMVRAACRDRRGNRIRSAGWIWAPGETDFEGYRYPDLQLVLDKKTYAPGETAKLLINTGAVGATALLGVEGRKLFDYRLVKIDKKTTVVELPVRSIYKPNFYVTVCLVKDGRFVTQEERAKVSIAEQEVRLFVTSDKKKYEPGETARYLVRAVDSKGKPVRAEVSFGVVDEAIYAIKEDDTPPILGYFYRMQPNLVSTRFSFPDVYLSGDKGGFTGKVRTEFKDTAFFRADLVTDEKGEARVAVKLPDNLTTWRATVRACDSGAAFGEARLKIVVGKPLLVRLQTPRFLIEGDEAVISTAVHNYLPDARRVKVTLNVSGAELDGSRQRNVEVPSQGMKRIDWKIKAGSAGKAEFTAYAVGGSEAKAQDAMKLVIPVRPDGQRMVETRFGIMKGGGRDINLVVRGDAAPAASEIRLRLSPSPASALLGSLDYLAQYPYGCTEQTMSCFLPDVVIWRTLKSLGIDNPLLEKRLPDMVGKGLNRLYDMQNEDGGWGWCEYSSQDMWMTAYVVYGLVTARNAGFKVNGDVLAGGFDALNSMLSQDENLKSQDAWYAIYVLSLAGHKTEAERYLEKAISLHNYPDNSHQLALAALVFVNLGRMDSAWDMMNKLWGRAEESPAEVCWKASSWDYQDAETTALALTAALKINPNDSRIPKIVRWLISNRRYNYWYSTRDTAMVIYAVSEYLKRTGELKPDFTAVVKHNGRLLGKWRFDKSTVFKPEIEIVVSPDKVNKGGNTLRIEMSGSGALYYTTSLTQYVKRGYGEKSPKVVTASGISIERTYYKVGMSKKQIESADFRVGDTVEVKLVINSPKDYRRVIIEDYLPAGFEAFDRGRLESWEWSSLGYWWADRDVRDERVTFYLDELTKGTSVLTYRARAGMPGDYRAPAVLAEGMYDPGVRASGAGARIRIRD